MFPYIIKSSVSSERIVFLLIRMRKVHLRIRMRKVRFENFLKCRTSHVNIIQLCKVYRTGNGNFQAYVTGFKIIPRMATPLEILTIVRRIFYSTCHSDSFYCLVFVRTFPSRSPQTDAKPSFRVCRSQTACQFFTSPRAFVLAALIFRKGK